jgi:outer membrane biosynthesis protein TonB
MTKKLNISSITNELEESAFFPSKKTLPVSPTPKPIVDKPKSPEVTKPTIEPKPQVSERPNARTVNA